MQKPTDDSKSAATAAVAAGAAAASAGAAAVPAAPAPADSTTELYDSETGEPFHTTFSLDSEADRKRLVDFFNTNGYVAIRDVLSAAECKATVAEMGADMRARSATATGMGSGAVAKDGKLFDIDDVNTYDRAPITSRYGMYTSVPLFTDQLTRNRQHPRIYDAMRLLYGECGHEPSGGREILVNHDSCCFYRPTRPHMPNPTSDVVPQPTWATGDGKDRRELHLDFHPTGAMEEHFVKAKRDRLEYTSDLRDFLGDNNFYVHSDGLQLACVLNLVDNRNDDGGFHCVPTFPDVYGAWCTAKGYDALAPRSGAAGGAAAAAASGDAKKAGAGGGTAKGKADPKGAGGKPAKGAAPAAAAAAAGKQKAGVAPTAAAGGAGAAAAAGAGADAGAESASDDAAVVAPRGVEAGSYHFSDGDKVDMKFLGPRGITRVNVPAGALIVWDQRMAHGSCPNTSDRVRIAQFMKWFPKRLFTPARLARRKKALTKVLTDNGWLTRVGLTDVGKTVFGW